MNFYTGTSGWSYPQWKGGFYPKGLKAGDWFSSYVSRFNAVEVNSSFYRLPSSIYIARWVERSPRHFRFAAKAWKAITHEAKLRDCEATLTQCLDSLRGFGEKLGCVLFQLPPSLKRDDVLLADFLALLPKDMRFAFEFRHASWQDARVYTLLADRQIALCQSHMREWTSARVITAPFLYIRLHGAEHWFKGSYSAGSLAELADYIRASGVNDAFVFFNNTMIGNTAPENAAALQSVLASMVS